MKCSSITVALCLIAAAGACLAQTTTATMGGNVSDGSGAAIVGAKVTATNRDTNVSRSAATQSDGSYSLLFLPIGTYQLEITATGFKKFEQTGIVLEVNRNAKIDAILQVGALSETVEVSADGSVVETTQPSLGQIVTN